MMPVAPMLVPLLLAPVKKWMLCATAESSLSNTIVTGAPAAAFSCVKLNSRFCPTTVNVEEDGGGGGGGGTSVAVAGGGAVSVGTTTGGGATVGSAAIVAALVAGGASVAAMATVAVDALALGEAARVALELAAVTVAVGVFVLDPLLPHATSVAAVHTVAMANSRRIFEPSGRNIG